jgi:hypothetical protein
MSGAKLLAINFEGFFMCRLATDPDPTNERRGASGYTMALAGEPDMDQVIRLQLDEELKKTLLRPPALANSILPGVTVGGVQFDGQNYAPGDKLRNTPVNLTGRTSSFVGPTFQSRNNIVGSDDTMAFAVDPFDIRIGGLLRALDFLDPADAVRFHDGGNLQAEIGPGDRCFKTTEIWQIANPQTYLRRFPIAFNGTSQEAQEAIGVFDMYRYFRDRRRFLDTYIRELEAGATPDRETKIQAARSRIFQIEEWGWRVANKLAFQTSWQHGINGIRHASDELQTILGGKIADEPWTISYWFGGWDGDLLTGYLRGQLTVPFTPAS